MRELPGANPVDWLARRGIRCTLPGTQIGPRCDQIAEI